MSLARPTGRITPRDCARPSSCASSSVRSAGARSCARSRARRSRPPASRNKVRCLVRITVLGKSPAWQDANGACSGYLVEGGGQVVLLDCGSGVFAKLRTVVDYETVDAVVISHLHADHILDLVTFASGIRFRPWPGEAPRPRLIAPPGAGEAFASLGTGGGMTAAHIELAFALSIYDPAQPLALGGLAVRFQPVPHYIPANAVEFAEGGARFTFGADCGPSEELCAFAAGTDLLIAEATLPEP